MTVNGSFKKAYSLLLTAPELLLHRLPQLLVRHVQIPLSRLEVCMTQQKLNRPQIQAAGQPTTSRLVPQIVPVQFDLRQLLAIHPSPRSCSCRLDAMSQQHERFPRRADRALVLSGPCAEHVRLWAEEASTLEQLRQASLRLERNAPRFPILRVLHRNDDLVGVSEHVTVLDLQHLAEPAGCFQGADDSIAHLGARERVLGPIELVGGFE